MRGGSVSRRLTEGNEAKVIIAFAFPMLAGNVFQQLYTTVDGIIVGRFVGTNALAAVGASFPIVFFMVSLVMGVTIGSSVMVAQFFGAGDHERLKMTIDTTAAFLFGAGTVITIVGIGSCARILRAMRVPPAVFPEAHAYLTITFAGMVFMFGYHAIAAVLRGVGDSVRPLYFLIVATATNIVLDLLFVVVFGWGIRGVAWATVLSHAVSFLVGVRSVRRVEKGLTPEHPRALALNRRIFSTMLRIGLPSGVQQSLVSLGFIALTRIVAPFGADVMAGFTAASRLDSFAGMPAMNLSMALSMFVGQNLGAGKPERVRRGFSSTMAIALLLSGATALVMRLWGQPLVRLFTTDASVVRHGRQYLVVVSSFYVLFAAMFVTGGVLRGAGDTFVQMLFTLTALWVVRIPTAAFLGSRFGPQGIWWGIPAGWVVGASLSFAYYLTGRWRHKVVVRPPTPLPS